MSDTVISVRDLRKAYGDLEAVRGIDLDVRAGEVFAVLGPNGAGKTTTVEILEGYRSRSGGEVTVLGHDPGRVSAAGASGRLWRERIGIVLQSCDLEPFLTVRETLELYAGYYRRPRSVADVIALVGLAEDADRRVGKLSGGRKRRLDVGVALIGDPDLIFLDEPTTGFDPSARRHAWEMFAGLRDLGKTILLTTHYMEEAQELADRVVIISAGRIVASGTPDDLGDRSSEPTRISFTLPRSAPELPGSILPSGAAVDMATPGGSVVIRAEAVTEALHSLTAWAVDNGLELGDLEVRRPTLEDTYLRLTSQDAEPAEGLR